MRWGLECAERRKIYPGRDNIYQYLYIFNFFSISTYIHKQIQLRNNREWSGEPFSNCDLTKFNFNKFVSYMLASNKFVKISWTLINSLDK